MGDFVELRRVGRSGAALRQVRALTGGPRARTEADRLVVEGTTAVLEALQNEIPVELLVFADSPQGQDAYEALRTFEVPGAVADVDHLAAAASTASAPPVLAVCGIPRRAFPVTYRLIVVADALADPGNAGGLMRVTEAGGADGLVLGAGSVDPWSPKVVRASAGAWARLRVMQAELPELLAAEREDGATVIGLDAGAGVDYATVEPPEPAVVVVGNESHGISEPVREQIDRYVNIPMAATTESLNAMVAVAVVLFGWRSDR